MLVELLESPFERNRALQRDLIRRNEVTFLIDFYRLSVGLNNFYGRLEPTFADAQQSRSGSRHPEFEYDPPHPGPPHLIEFTFITFTDGVLIIMIEKRISIVLPLENNILEKELTSLAFICKKVLVDLLTISNSKS